MGIAAFVGAACGGAGSGGGSSAGTGATVATGGGATGGTGAAGGTGATAGSGAIGGDSGAGGSAGSGASGTGASGGTPGTGGSGATGGSGGAGGPEICNNQQDDDADGFYDCDDTDCFADSGCIANDLSVMGLSGFVPCGKPVPFTLADSDATCQKYAQGWSPNFASKCQYASYTGTVSFYCPPKPNTDAVGVRWVGHGNVPTEIVNGKPILWETLAGEYAFGNGGGSVNNPLHKSFDIQSGDMVEDFVGYQKLGVTASAKGPYTLWFAIWDLNGGQAPQVSGGFTVDVDAAQLFSSY